MESSSCIITFSKPTNYDDLINYDKEPREGFEKMFLKLPPKDEVRQALTDFSVQSNFKYCKPNKGYIQALGVNKVY